MIVEDIIQIGNPILSQKSETVSDFSSVATQKVVRNLTDSMRYHGIIGMAASQIGEKQRIFVTEIRKTKYRDLKEDELRVFINPKITWYSENEVVLYEGCGSVAYTKLFGPVRRPEKIEIEAYSAEGKKFKLKVEGMLARVIQHEYDHLDGIEFTEKITDMKKIMSSEEYRKMVQKIKHDDHKNGQE